MIRYLACAIALAITTPAFATVPDAAALQGLAQRARPGVMGILVMNPATGATVSVNGERAFMMMSTFKAPVAAAVLAQVDAGKLRLDQKVHLVPGDVVAGSAVPSIGTRLASGAFDATVDELLKAAVSESDNTAVDALLRLVGGGKVATDYLRSRGVEGMRIDFGEGEFGKMFNRLGYAVALDAKQNTTTLAGAASFLRKLQAGQLLSAASTQRLLAMMTAQTIPNRIRGGLPAGYSLADKTGTGPTIKGHTAAWNDIGIVTAPDGTHTIVVAFLRDSSATADERNALFAELGRMVSASP